MCLSKSDLAVLGTIVSTNGRRPEMTEPFAKSPRECSVSEAAVETGFVEISRKLNDTPFNYTLRSQELPL